MDFSNKSYGYLYTPKEPRIERVKWLIMHSRQVTLHNFPIEIEGTNIFQELRTFPINSIHNLNIQRNGDKI